MKLQYLGHSCFRIISNFGNSIVCDPYKKDLVGYSMPTVKSDVVTVSHGHSDHNYTEGVLGSPAVIDIVGDCVMDDIAISSFTTNHDEVGGAKRGNNIVFVFAVDGFRVAHLGDLGEYTKETVAKLQGCDVLLMPVGGNYTIDALTAKRIVDEVCPKIVVPMHFDQGGIIDIARVEDFTDLFEAQNVTHYSHETLTLGEDFEENQPVKVIVMKRIKD